MFYETKTRSFVKTILWRIIATFITWMTIYVFTGNLSESVEITIVAAIFGMTAYYVYERVWNKIIWDKYIKRK